jgi:hypothetical protein
MGMLMAALTACLVGPSATASAADPAVGAEDGGDVMAARSDLASAERAETAADRNRLLLELIGKAMSDDPQFRTALSALLVRSESQEIAALREAVKERDMVIRELKTEVVALRAENGFGDGELGTQPNDQAMPVTGTLTIDNQCPYFVRVKINDQTKSIGPGRFDFPVSINPAEATVSTELVGYGAPRSWKLAPPDYSATFVIRP